MNEGIHPALPVFLAAASLPFLPQSVRRALTVLAPLAALACLAALADGEGWRVTFLGLPLVLIRADALARIFALAFVLIAFLANLYGWHRTRIGEQAAGLGYLGGGLMVVLAGDLVTLLVGWEVTAVAATFLVLAGATPAALHSGLRYLLVHLTAGGALLLGVLEVIAADAPLAFGALGGSPGATWILLALCINAAVPPLHAWLPDAYPQASVSGTVFLSAFTTKAAVYCLIRGFPGNEALVWLGAAMTLYGVVFAILENNTRRLLAYHIVSQVGYMVCGAGIGTPMALNGASAHAFCHILYKGLLLMGVGSVVAVTGRDRLTELGGLARRMPLTLVLYMIGAFSISGLPLFNGFVSKSVVVTGAAEAGRGLIVLALSLASVGTFLSVALKLPYFAWFGTAPDARPPASEASRPMLAAMTLTAFLCVWLGVAPAWLYARLPFPPLHYEPYTAVHVFEVLLVASFTLLAFRLLLARLQPHAGLNLDTDWFYRRPGSGFVAGVSVPLDRYAARMGAFWSRASERLVDFSRNPPLALTLALRRGKTEVTDAADATSLPRFDEDRQRPPVAQIVLWVLTVFVVLCVAFVRGGG
jgi:multicomponent Na+:H+ antiporter subunit D